MTTEELQSQKLQLEIDKLNSDIEKANAPFYKASDFWKSVIPTLITTCAVFATLYFTVGRSFVDDEKRKLELQKEQLKLEIMQFDGVKVEIQKDIAASTIDKNALLSRIKLLQNQKDALGGNILSLKGNENKLREDINDLNFETYAVKAEYRDIKSAYSKDTAYYRKVINKRFITDDGYKKKLELLDQNNEKLNDAVISLTTEVALLKKKKKFTEQDLYEVTDAVLKAKIERYTKMAKQHQAESDTLMKAADKSFRQAEKQSIEVDRLENQHPYQPIYLPSLLELSEQRKKDRQKQRVKRLLK